MLKSDFSLMPFIILILISSFSKAQDFDLLNQVSCSPVGSKICFTAEINGQKELFIMNEDGTGINRLTNDEFRDAYPSWSPDGEKIIYTKVVKKTSQLYTISTDGTNEKTLFEDGYSNSFATFSPDGSQIAYMSKRNGKWQLFIYSLTNETKGKLISSESNDFNPIWSYDGKYIVFESDRTGNDQDDIFIINNKTKKISQVTDTQEHNDVYPIFSPTNYEVLFLSLRNRMSNLYSINMNGKNEAKIAEKVWFADWMRDGKRMFVISYKNGVNKRNFEIIDLQNNSVIPIQIKYKN